MWNFELKYIMEFKNPFSKTQKHINNLKIRSQKSEKLILCITGTVRPIWSWKKVVFSWCAVAYVRIYCPMSALLLLRLNHKVTELTSGLLFDCFLTNMYIFCTSSIWRVFFGYVKHSLWVRISIKFVLYQAYD